MSLRAVEVFIGLGANLGDRAAAISGAVELLNLSPSIEVLRTSSMHETEAVGGPPGSPKFLNAVTKLRVMLAPPALLDELLRIERTLGRTRRHKWEPRPIDLDILLFGDQIISSDALVVPHPLMHERRFVLAPLAEIAPDVVHPVLQMTARGLLEALPAGSRVQDDRQTGS